MTSYRLVVFQGDSVLSQGTAWLVSADRVVTAFHVVGENALKAFFHSGLANVRYVLEASQDEHPLTPLTFDPIADIALLSLSDALEEGIVLQLASRDRRVPGVEWSGESFPGFHKGRAFTLSGKVDALRGSNQLDSLQLHVQQGTQVDWSGVSGAPVIDDKTHAVIGLITEMTANAATGWGATTTAIERVLNKFESRSAGDQATSNPSLLYQIWLDELDQHNATSNNAAAGLLRRLFRKYAGRESTLEGISRQLMDDAWPDLLITISSAIRGTAPADLIDDIKSRLLGAQYLAIHLIWRPENDLADRLKDAIYSALSRPVHDAAAFGLGIPVYFWKEPSFELLELNQAQHSLVVVLIDDKMVESESWRQALHGLSRRIPDVDPRNWLMPCGLTAAAQNLEEQFDNRAVLDLSDRGNAAQQRILLIRLTHRLLNLVRDPRAGDEEKAHIFVSYARADGVHLAEELQKSLVPHFAGSVEIVVDTSHAVSGRGIERFIELIPNGVVVVLHTDSYSSRVWCQKEVLLAKEKGVPILEVTAVKKGEHRTFPYLGNVRTLNILEQGEYLPGWPSLVVGEALIELLFHHMFCKRAHVLEAVGLIKNDTPRSSRQPELLSIVNKVEVQTREICLHPDPPLFDGETEVLRMAAPEFEAVTPTTIVAENFPHKAMRVALSISNPATLEQQGLEALHLHDVWVALTRHLMLSGAQLSYGLDLRAGGYGEIMLALLHQRENVARYKSEPARSLIAWPLHLKKDTNKSAKSWSDLTKVVRRELVELPPLARTVDRTKFLSPDSVEGQYLWCRSLTHMRHKLMSEVDALVAIGGSVKGYKGKYPGVVEEIQIALKNDVPVFVVGGFGGCCDAVAHSLRELTASELTLDYQTRETGRRELIDYYNREREIDSKPGDMEDPIDYDVLRNFFAEKGLLGLGNGLSISENRRLLVTKSGIEIVWLVLKGLSAIRRSEE